MKKNVYVLNHDFGYGKERENEEVWKLFLRDIDDVTDYVKTTFSTFVANVKGFTVEFKSDRPSEEVIIELI